MRVVITEFVQLFVEINKLIKYETNFFSLTTSLET